MSSEANETPTVGQPINHAGDDRRKEIAKPAFDGSALRRMRHERFLTLTEISELSRRLAKRTGNPAFFLYKSRVSAIELGSAPGPEKVLALAEIYGLTISDLVKLYSRS